MTQHLQEKRKIQMFLSQCISFSHRLNDTTMVYVLKQTVKEHTEVDF